MLGLDARSGDTATLQLTPDYASPEQFRGEPVTPASDVYSLGVMLFQLLTGGARPRQTTGADLAGLLEAITHEDPPAPSTKATTAFRDQLRGDLDSIVLAALSTDPQRRYASAGRMADDLRRFRDGLPVWAHADSTTYRVRKFARRHWVLFSSTATIILALVAAVAMTARQAHIARLEKEAADRARAGEQQQRLLAERALASAEAERARALEEKERAEWESGEATRQRTLAEGRYQDVRSLATSLLFDINDQVRGLAGASAVRRVAVTKALQYLDALYRQSHEDPAVGAELAAAYERAGDILGNIADSSMEGARAAMPPYSRALELRKQVAARRPGQAAAREALGRAHEKVGVGYLGLGRGHEAVASFEAAMRLLGDRPSVRAEILDRLSSAYAALTDFDRSMTYCREALALIESPQSGPPSPAPDKLIARIVRQYGILCWLSGKYPEAIRSLRRAADLLVSLARQEPDQVTYRRSYASMLPALARSYQLAGQTEEADKVWVDARAKLTGMLPQSPMDPQIVLTLAYTLKQIAWNRYHASQAGKGSDTGEEEMALALEHSGRIASRPQAGVYELIEYADTLIKVPYPRLQNHQRALEFALRGNQLSKFQNPLMLDTLAWAYFRTGDVPAAIQTMEKALGLLSPSAEPTRKELEDALRQFREAAAK